MPLAELTLSDGAVAVVGAKLIVGIASWTSYLLVKMLAHVEYFSMPNNLLPQPIVPELIQSRANVENLVHELSRYLLDPDQRQTAQEAIDVIISSLRSGANERAADAVSEILAGPAKHRMETV